MQAVEAALALLRRGVKEGQKVPFHGAAQELNRSLSMKKGYVPQMNWFLHPRGWCSVPFKMP